MLNQQTLRAGFAVEGIGLHSGRECICRVEPAPEGNGFTFERIDCPGSPAIRGHWTSVSSGRLATTLSNGEAQVSTVEHLLSALYGMGVDNAHIRVDQEEIPAMDGSARSWVSKIEEVGIEEQGQPQARYVISDSLEVIGKGRYFRCGPGLGLVLDVTADFEHPDIGEQQVVLELTPENYKRELAWARTFGFKEDLTALRELGLGQGGSLDNALVFDKSGVVNPGGLRGEGEVVRHKTVDMVGDLALSGVRFEGRMVCRRPGHAFTHLVLQRLRP